MRYVVVDPSGNYDTDGKGHTGIAVLDDNDWGSLKAFSLYAKDYPDRHTYWKEVTDVVVSNALRAWNSIVIIESFVIRNNGFMIGKMPETIRMIGHLEYEMEDHAISYTFQTPAQAKARFTDASLVAHIPGLTHNPATKRYYLGGKVVNDHVRDALKHLLYFKRYKETK